MCVLGGDPSASIMIPTTARGIVCRDCGQFIPEQSIEDWFDGIPDHICNPPLNLTIREARPAVTQPQPTAPSPRILTMTAPPSARSTPIHQQLQRVNLDNHARYRSRRGPSTPEPLSGVGLRRHQLINNPYRRVGPTRVFTATALDELLQLRTDAYFMMENLGRLFRRVTHERAEQEMEYENEVGRTNGDGRANARRGERDHNNNRRERGEDREPIVID